MEITVILCTYNRCQSLARALESLAASRVPPGIDWEVLVVDNNSSDATRSVAETFCRRYPGRFRYLFEPVQGKSWALNSGIQDTQSDFLAFTDDDVEVDPNWVYNITAPLRSEGLAGCGGRIFPARSFQPPRWFPSDPALARGPLVMFDLGDEPGDLTRPPFGANMAFTRSTFARHGGFRTDLGPRPGSEIRSEDSEYVTRLLAAGERLRYEPSAVVYHEIPDSRLQRRFFLDWWFDKGRAETRAFGVLPEMRHRIAGVPFVQLRRIAVWTLQWLTAVTPSRRFSARLNVWVIAGRIVEAHRLWRQKVSPQSGVAHESGGAGWLDQPAAVSANPVFTSEKKEL